MKRQHDPVRVQVAQKIQDAIQSVYGDLDLGQNSIYDLLGDAPSIQMGHLAFGCFPLAKICRKGPPQIAAELAEAISKDDLIAEAKPVGPYLNFFFHFQSFGKQMIEPILKGSAFEIPLTENTPKTMVEYSQPNTHKELHVGHMRNLCLGDAVVRLFRYAGYDVIRATFPGDVGTHVAKCLWYMKYHNQEPIPQTGKGEWLGRMYSKGSILLEDEKGTEKEDANREKLTEILRQLEKKEGEFFELWKETRQWSIDLMKSVYEWAGVEFDHWYWESDVDSDSVQLIQKYYEEGLFVKDQGAIGMDLNSENLGFCLLIKSDGNGLYATKDIELARRKFEDHQIQKSIYVVDVRQALHFKQVFRVLEKMGFEDAKNCFHLKYEFVELPDGPMSSRKGNIIPLTDLIHQLQEEVKTMYLERYRGDWSDAEIENTADQVAQGAIKFGMTRIDNNRKIVFDMKEWLKIDGESGPYVQYVYARIRSLYRKMGYSETDLYTVDWSLLTEEIEQSVALKVSQFNAVVLSAAEEMRPSTLCSYLFDLGKLFNSFYQSCPVGAAPSEELKKARMALAQSVAETLKKGLGLLGIPAPEKM